MVLLIIEDDIYDVSKYVSSHPGEGINNAYLKDFNLKNCSSVFDRYHFTNKPFEILEKAKKIGSYNGVFWVCPNFFKRRIPKYFYFHSENKKYSFSNDYEYILKRNENDIFNSLSLIIHDKGNIESIDIVKNEDGLWKLYDLEDENIEKLLRNFFEKK